MIDLFVVVAGLDDAKNIARILIRLAKDGCPIKVNAHIKKSLTDIEKAPGENNDDGQAKNSDDE